MYASAICMNFLDDLGASQGAWRSGFRKEEFICQRSLLRGEHSYESFCDLLPAVARRNKKELTSERVENIGHLSQNLLELSCCSSGCGGRAIPLDELVNN